MEVFRDLLGLFMIFFIIDYKRKGESIIKIYSWNYWFKMIVVVTACLLFNN